MYQTLWVLWCVTQEPGGKVCSRGKAGSGRVRVGGFPGLIRQYWSTSATELAQFWVYPFGTGTFPRARGPDPKESCHLLYAPVGYSASHASTTSSAQENLYFNPNTNSPSLCTSIQNYTSLYSVGFTPKKMYTIGLHSQINEGQNRWSIMKDNGSSGVFQPQPSQTHLRRNVRLWEFDMHVVQEIMVIWDIYILDIAQITSFQPWLQTADHQESKTPSLQQPTRL